MNLHDSVVEAEARIRPYVRETPLDRSLALSQGGDEVYLKLENLQYTGSFKLRGAVNKLLALAPAQRARGVVAASSGNHGAAVAYGCRLLGVAGLIFVPGHASTAKVAAIRRLGAEVRFYGDDGVDTEVYAREHATRHGQIYVSPYNDWDVVAGQGTIAAELDRQVAGVDAVLVSVGGGGLIAGIAGYLKARRPNVTVIGCLPENSPVMAESVRAGRLLDVEIRPTLSDGTAGGIEPGAITFDLCRALVDDYVLVGEAEIAAAVRMFVEDEHMLIEGAAGVAVAAYLAQRGRLRGKRAAIVICGANISAETLKRIL